MKDLEEVEREVVLHGVPTLTNGVKDKKADGDRVKKILRELRPGGYIVQNGDVEGSKRQRRNIRKIDKQPNYTKNSRDGRRSKGCGFRGGNI